MAGWVLAGLLLCLPACGASPMQRWQRDLEHFVMVEHHGDMNSIRLASEDGDRFDSLGGRADFLELFPAQRDDVHGVILGRRELLGEPWTFFLVGVVRFKGMLENLPVQDSELRDVRLVAVRATPREMLWIVGEQDKRAMERYKAAQAGDVTTFPTPGDRFGLEVSGQGARAVESRSGAAWEIPPEQ